MRVGIVLLQSLRIDDNPQLIPCGINRKYIQLKLKSKAKSFEKKTTK